jgi:hypothetical protein
MALQSEPAHWRQFLPNSFDTRCPYLYLRSTPLLMKAQRKARQQLHSFLLRPGRTYPSKNWTQGASPLAS